MKQKLFRTLDFYKAKWLLYKHGCSSREEYERKVDPDHCSYATRIKDYYHGYPYICCFGHPIYDWEFLKIQEDTDWCKNNCRGKYRLDCHRVSKNDQDEWEMNEMFGEDCYFVAFKEKTDYLYFLLARA